MVLVADRQLLVSMQRTGANVMDVYETIKHFILNHIVRDTDADSLSADTPLEDSGILDSLSVLKLVAFLEEKFDIEFTAADADAGGFSSIRSVARMVERKIAERAASSIT